MVKKGALFVLRKWQFSGKYVWDRMSKVHNFCGCVVFASDWDVNGNVIEFNRVSWMTVQCEICVCLYTSLLLYTII